MGEDNIPLLVAQVGELLGIPGRRTGVVETLAPGVGGLVPGVIEVQIVQSPPLAAAVSSRPRARAARKDQ